MLSLVCIKCKFSCRLLSQFWVTLSTWLLLRRLISFFLNRLASIDWWCLNILNMSRWLDVLKLEALWENLLLFWNILNLSVAHQAWAYKAYNRNEYHDAHTSSPRFSSRSVTIIVIPIIIISSVIIPSTLVFCWFNCFLCTQLKTLTIIDFLSKELNSTEGKIFKGVS